MPLSLKEKIQGFDDGLPDSPRNQTKYEYDPYGNLIASDGTYAAVNPWRFSTKWFDDGLYYYGYRYYSPRLGRWISRDPIEEAGGLNLYGFVGNCPNSNLDLLGLLSDADAAGEMLWHWLFGGGAKFYRRGGAWEAFIAKLPAWSGDAQNKLQMEAAKILSNTQSDYGMYWVPKHLMFINGFWTVFTLNGVQYEISGGYTIDRKRCEIRFDYNEHTVTDRADANGWKDVLIKFLHAYGQLGGYSLDQSGVHKRPGMFEYFDVELSWNVKQISFKYRNDRIVSATGGWPFEK